MRDLSRASGLLTNTGMPEGRDVSGGHGHAEPTTLDLGMDLPLDALSAHLAEHGLDLVPSQVARRFTGGFGNTNFLLEVNGSPVVLRRPPPGPLPPGANDMGREFKVLSRLWERFVLAPRALHFCADEGVIGAPFLMMEFRSGLVVREVLPASAEGQGEALSEMLAKTLAQLHAVDPESVGLGDLGRPEGFLERTIEGWCKRASVATDGQAPAALDDLAQWLRDNCVSDSEVTLIHNDFKLNNIIVDPCSPATPLAVLDWDMCTRGDPLFDLATLLSYWVEPGDPEIMRNLKQMPLACDGFLTREALALRYADLTGRDLSDFVFHRVLAMFKLGVVFLQLHGRYRRGQTTDERYAGFRKLAEGILDFTLDIAAARVF